MLLAIQELLFGILCVTYLPASPIFLLDDVNNYSDLYPVQITFEFLRDNYNPNILKKQYTANIVLETGQVPVTFNTLEFIQGVITGARWLDINPHDCIANIKYRQTLLTF